MDGKTEDAVKAAEALVRAQLAQVEFDVDELTGAVSFKANGASYVLLFSTRVMRKVEGHFGQSFIDVADRLSTQHRVDDLVNVMRLGLSENHRLTMEDVDKIVDDLGYLQTNALVGKAMEAAFSKERPKTSRPLDNAA